MSPRLTDWSLALAAALAFVTGIVSLLSGLPQEWFIFALHGIVGIWLLLLLWGKLQRVWPRLIRPRRWDHRTVYGLLALLFVTLALGSGIWWVGGGEWYFAGFNLLNWHIGLGIVLTAFILFHMFARAKRLRKRDMAGRRHALHLGALLLGSVALWPGQQLPERAQNLPGARRRFTGSQEIGSYSGNAFPTSSWVADQPHPINVQTWRLSLGGAIAMPRDFSYDELVAVSDGLEATLDCTGGFYSTQRWRGVRLDRLLAPAGVRDGASHVRVVSHTGYPWTWSLDDAPRPCLPPHAGDGPLPHDPGAPVRLVAPDPRGFQGVKWVTRLELHDGPDPGAIASTVWSSFTPQGRGAA